MTGVCPNVIGCPSAYCGPKSLAEHGDSETLIDELRDVHRRRPRLQEEFNRAGLP